MQLCEVADASAEVGATAARLGKLARLAAVLAASSDEELPIIVAWLSGDLPQRQIGVGWAALRALPPAASSPALTVTEVDAALSAIGATSGAGSQARRASLLAALLGAATAGEQAFLRALLSGELRQGAQRGVMLDAVARAVAVPLAQVRRAAMLAGSLPAVAGAARTGGVEALRAMRLTVGRPVSPMLAQTAASLAEGMAKVGTPARLDAKIDGVRLQVHRNGDEVRLFTRTLDEVTARLPEVLAAVRALPVTQLVADAEAIALRPDGRPEPFQVTSSRLGRRTSPAARELTTFFFDVLHVDGRDLLDEPASVRLSELARVVPQAQRVRHVVTSELGEGQAFVDSVLAAGHEGVMIKSLDAAYEAGRRGAGWLKLKPVHTLDLVVLAAEWGSGRRRGWLSNIHLGARNPQTGEFVMLGKTFKGMTDEMLAWQTQRFTELAAGGTSEWVVPVRPEQVVEIAFDGVQASSRYPGGVTLRFARVIRYRDDKPASEADTLAAVREMYDQQHG